MTIYPCDMCHAVIPASRLAARHYTKERLATMLLFCDQQCLVAWREEHGFYGAISVLPQARERRRAALAQSNRERLGRSRTPL